MIRASTNSQVRYQVNFVVINKHKLAAGTNWYHGVKQQLSIVVQGIINTDPPPFHSPLLGKTPTFSTFSSDPFIPRDSEHLSGHSLDGGATGSSVSSASINACSESGEK